MRIKRMPRLPDRSLRGELTTLLSVTHVGRRHVNVTRSAGQLSAALNAALAGRMPGAVSARAADVGSPVDGWSTTVQVAGDGTVTAEAHKGDANLKFTERDTLDVNSCPDGAGEVPGSRHWLLGLDGTIPADKGYSVRLHIRVAEDGHLLGRADDSSAFKDFDLDEHFLGHAQFAVLSPAGRVVATNPPTLESVDVARQHVPPGVDYAHAYDGVRVSNDVITAEPEYYGLINHLQKIINFQFDVTIDRAGGKDGEYPRVHDHNWVEGGCVTVSSTAPKKELAPEEAVDVTVVPQVQLASHTPLTITAITDGTGSVSPAQATAKPGEAVHFTYTAPNSDSWLENLKFRAVSRQGIGVGVASFESLSPQAYQYDVTLTGGQGSYAEQDSYTSGPDTNDSSFSDTFTFTSTWHGAVIPVAGGPQGPAVSATTGNLSGSNETVNDASNGVQTSHFDCTSPLTDTNARSEFTQNVRAAAGGAAGTRVTINGWTSLQADNAHQSCTQSGFYTVPAASAGGAGLTDLSTRYAYMDTVTLTPAQLAQPAFTISLANPSFPTNCDHPNGTTCSHTLSWQATVTFTKIGTCTADAYGQYSCRPL